jgi:beta-galactosidase GanA
MSKKVCSRFRVSLKGIWVAVACAAVAALHAAPSASPAAHSVSFDSYSFLIDGQRTYLWSGEFHPYRLPSPELWKDIFQKMKAAGFNTTSIYFSWGYHSAREGEYDFSGIRDMDRVLDAARDAGIYVIARPGPYINAEVDSGGFPLWLTTKKLRNRSADPEYLRYSDEWLTQIDRILARHQWVDGRGTVIAYQIENEYYIGSDDGRAYMEHLESKARADGISVPLVGNHDGTFVEGKGAVAVSGWDYYPQGFDCSNPAVWKPAPDMSRARTAGQPLFTAEFQGGAFDPWGGPGYPQCAELINDRFANVFYKENIAAGATAQNFYMLFGGTSWGWQSIPQNYTSYDYGAAITEARQFDPKYYEDKRIGYFVTGTAPLLKTAASASAQVDDPGVIDIARTNPDTGTEFHLIRHGDTTSAAVTAVHLSLTIDGTRISVPQRSGSALTLNGRESKLLVANYPFGAQRLVYSTSELMTSATIGGRDIIVLYGDRNSPGETVLHIDGGRDVHVLEGAADVERTSQELRLNYIHAGLTRVWVTGGARPLLVLIADKKATERIWRQETSQAPVLVIGSHLLRTAAIRHGALALTGDGDDDGAAEIFAPPITSVTWNGAALQIRQKGQGARGIAVSLPNPSPISLPKLDGWHRRDGAPEIARDFDDRAWRTADLTSSSSITKPVSNPVLLADDYGFHTGNTWYRGHFAGNSSVVPTGLRLRVQSGGTAGEFTVWLNGHFLGSVQHQEEAAFGFPEKLIERGDNVVSILTVNMGHEEDYQSKGENRTGRGIVFATPLGTPSTAVSWRIQGRRGGEGATDALRGPYNEGGLFGEREGWPGRPTAGADGHDPEWTPTALPAADATPGVTWFRTAVTLALPKDQDTSIGIQIKEPPGRHYRAILFVNGWHMGNYVSDMGPQRSFPIPNGVLHPQGSNSIVMAVWKTDQSAGSLGEVSLINYGSYKSGLVTPAAPHQR